MRILVAEDERDLNRLIERRLEREGFAVDCAHDGYSAENMLLVCDYDAVILDIMMPGPNGLSILRSIRERGAGTPVIMLTALDSIDDRVNGLDTGADDYISKPFSLDELSARLKAVLRRAGKTSGGICKVADLTVDLALGRATRAGKVIDLSAKEFAVLARLAQNVGAVISRDDIVAHCWSYDYTGNSNVVDVYIRYLRQKIDDPFDKKLLHTVRGVGYVLRDADDKN